MSAQIGLSLAQRQGGVAVFSTLLADEYMLYTKTRNCHTGLMEQHEKMAWMLRAFLAGTTV